MNAPHQQRRGTPALEYIVPQSSDSEAAIIGSLLMKGGESFDDISPPITAAHFFTRSHRVIFSASLDLHLAGKQVDLITVTSELQRRSQLEQIGGAFFVAGLCGKFFVQLDHHVKVVCEKYRLRRLAERSEWLMRNAHIAEDAEEFLGKAEKDILDISQDVITDNLMASAGVEVLEDIARKRRGEKITGLKTGVQLFDEHFGGIKRGRMIVIGARPGRGKTAMVEQIADRLTQDGHPVTFFEKDIHPSALLGRMACRNAGVPFTMLDRGNPSEAQFCLIEKAVGELLKRPLQVLSPPRLTGYDIRAIARKSVRQYRTECVILDHFQLLDHDEEDMTQGLTRASIQIKQSVQDTGVPHIVVAQLNRDADRTGRPAAGNVKQCDQLFADCDVLILLWGEEDQNKVAPGEFLTVKCTIAKNRYGPTGEEDLLFDGCMMKFVPKYHGEEPKGPPPGRRARAAQEPFQVPTPYKD